MHCGVDGMILYDLHEIIHCVLDGIDHYDLGEIRELHGGAHADRRNYVDVLHYYLKKHSFVYQFYL